MALYRLDSAHSAANFSVKHLMISKVHGGFEKIAGTMEFDHTDITKTQINIEIEAGSVTTREAERDAHLKGPDFFDVENFPYLKFKSTKVEGSRGNFKIEGELTIKNITQSVFLEVEGLTEEVKDPQGDIKIGASAITKIKRKDFGLTWNAALKAGGFLVGDEVSVSVDVQFVKSES